MTAERHKHILRSMPIPGKGAGDPTDFDFTTFANSRVMALDAKPLSGPLKTKAILKLISRTKGL